MPNIKSAKKRVLINEKKNLRNRMALSAMKTAIRKVNGTIEVNNIELAEKLLPETFSIIDKTASKGVIHPNKAANLKSALAKKIHAIKTGKLVIAIKKTNEQIAAEKARLAKEVRAEQKAEQAKRRAAKELAAKEKEKETKGKKVKATLDAKEKKGKQPRPEKAKKDVKPAKAEKSADKTSSEKPVKAEKQADKTSSEKPAKAEKPKKEAKPAKAEKPKK